VKKKLTKDKISLFQSHTTIIMTLRKFSILLQTPIVQAVYGKCEEDINAPPGDKGTLPEEQYTVPTQQEPVYREIVAEPNGNHSIDFNESVYYVPDQEVTKKDNTFIESKTEKQIDKNLEKDFVEESEYHTPEHSLVKSRNDHEDEQSYSNGYSVPEKSPLNFNSTDEAGDDDCEYYSTPASNETESLVMPRLPSAMYSKVNKNKNS